jgi:hypothetical protein
MANSIGAYAQGGASDIGAYEYVAAAAGGRTVEATLATMSMADVNATLNLKRELASTLATMGMTTAAAVIATGRSIDASLATIAAADLNATAITNRELNATLGTMSAAALAATLTADTTIEASLATLAASTNAADINLQRQVAATLATMEAAEVATIRTNLCLQSEDLSSASWTKVTSTAAANVIANPINGAVTADSLVGDGAATSARAQQTITLEAGGNTFSCYLRPIGNLGWAYLTFGATGGAYFNIATGALGTSNSGFDSAIEDVGNGWYRCSVTETASSAGNEAMRIWMAEADNDISFAAAIPATDGYYMWGAQVETGTTATAYIPTTTTAVTVTEYAEVERKRLIECTTALLAIQALKASSIEGPVPPPQNGLRRSLIGCVGRGATRRRGL